MLERTWPARLIGMAAAVGINVLASVILVALHAPGVLGWLVIIGTFVAGLLLGRNSPYPQLGFGLALGAVLAPFLIVIVAVILTLL